MPLHPRLPRPRRVAAACAAAAVLCGGAATVAFADDEPTPQEIALRAQIAGMWAVTDVEPCTLPLRRDKWALADPADAGRAKPFISAHRGGANFAPENTLASYEAAMAYGVDAIEVDVRRTKDGHLVAFHDSTVDRVTNGTGPVADLTLAELKALKAGDYAPWIGTPYEDARVATFEEVLELAAEAGVGIEVDNKLNDTDAMAEQGKLVAEYGLIEESFFGSNAPHIAVAAPGAQFIFNRSTWESPSMMNEVTRFARYVGSTLVRFTPESIAAIHDGCGLAIPHAYDAGPENEVAEFLRARAMGADGVQTNQPELIVAAAGFRASSVVRLKRDGEGRLTAACLVNRRNGMGFLGRQLAVSRDGAGVATVTTGEHGCATLTGVDGLGTGAGVEVSFGGDPAIVSSRLRAGIDEPVLHATVPPFADQQAGTLGAPVAVTLRNDGLRALAISDVRVAGETSVTAPFLHAGDDCVDVRIAPGASCTAWVRFAPVAVGAAQGALVVEADTGDGRHRIALAGTGVAPSAGPEGPRGADGADGRDGANGAQGPQGPGGAAGPQGDGGPQGERGPAGASGPQGERGADGPAGPAGRDGTVTFASGAAGARGARGAKRALVARRGATVRVPLTIANRTAGTTGRLSLRVSVPQALRLGGAARRAVAAVAAGGRRTVALRLAVAPNARRGTHVVTARLAIGGRTLTVRVPVTVR
jgi:hypothetical protein